MKKSLLIILSIFVLSADIITNKNIEVLDALDIENSFIENKKLQTLYKIYAKNKKEFFLNVLENGYDYLPLIKHSILKSNFPRELISVAMAESYLTTSARSNKKAIGLWQFMPKTAKLYGLKINEYVDERKDPVKSTKAAIRYLNYLHRFFGKWYLAIMAYNAGEARVVEAVVRAKVDKLCNNIGKKCKNDPTIKLYRQIIKNYQRHGKAAFGTLYETYKKLKHIPITLNELLRFQEGLRRQYLPKETRRYILKILSLAFLFNKDDFIKYSDAYLLNSGISSYLKKIYVPAGTSLYYVSKILNIPYKELKIYNSHIKYPFTPPYRYYIYIPYNKITEFRVKFHPKKFFLVYHVKKGDTLYKISRQYHLRVKIIKDFNRLGRFLHIGEKLIIPVTNIYIKYKVKKGDSLRAIARKFNINYQRIINANKLKSSIIQTGQILKIPKGL